MKRIEKQGQSCRCADNNQPDVMRSNLISMHRSSITASKTIESQGRQVRRSTTVSSRIISRSHVPTSTDIRTLNVTGVDLSGVMSARSGSSPSINNLSANSDTHGVFSIDAFNEFPTNGDFANWISNTDAFVKELELWTLQNSVNKCGQADTPTQCVQSTQDIREINTLKNHSSDDEISNSCTDQTAAGSKNLKVAHKTILSYKNEARYV